MRSVVFPVLVLVSLFALGCSSDTSLERRGGPPPDPDGGAGSVGEPIPFCDAFKVVQAKCQRCHQDPPKNGAPVPFLSYEDTQAQYGTTEFKYSDVMLSAVETDLMPYLALNGGANPIMPPVEPLTAAEKATLLGWLKQGALPEGGTDCR